MTSISNIPRVGLPISQQSRATPPEGYGGQPATTHTHPAFRGQQAEAFHAVMERRNAEQIKADQMGEANEFLKAITWLIACMLGVCLITMALVNLPDLIATLFAHTLG